MQSLNRRELAVRLVLVFLVLLPIMKMAAAAAIIPAVDRGSCSTTCTFMAMEHNYKNQIVIQLMCRVGNQIAANSATDFIKVQRRVSALCYYTMPVYTIYYARSHRERLYLQLSA